MGPLPSGGVIDGKGMGGGTFIILDIRTASVNARLEIDCRMNGGGGFFCSYSAQILSSSALSPDTNAFPFRLIWARDGL